MSGTLITSMAITSTSIATTSNTDLEWNNRNERFTCCPRAEALPITDWPSFTLLIAFMELNACLIRDQPSLLLHRQFKLIRIESVSYRLNSRSCLNLRACLTRPWVNPSLGQTVWFSPSSSPLTTWLYHTHVSGMLHRSFKPLLASRRYNFRGGGWSHNNNNKKST